MAPALAVALASVPPPDWSVAVIDVLADVAALPNWSTARSCTAGVMATPARAVAGTFRTNSSRVAAAAPAATLNWPEMLPARAVSVCVPATVPSVHVPATARPCASETAEPVVSVPADGVKLTVTPASGLLSAARTITASGPGMVVPTVPVAVALSKVADAGDDAPVAPTILSPPEQAMEAAIRVRASRRRDLAAFAFTGSLRKKEKSLRGAVISVSRSHHKGVESGKISSLHDRISDKTNIW